MIGIDIKDLIEQIEGHLKKQTEERFFYLKQLVKQLKQDTAIQLYQACLQSQIQFDQEQLNKWYDTVFALPLTQFCFKQLDLEYRGTINFCKYLKTTETIKQNEIHEFIKELEKRKQKKIEIDKFLTILEEQINDLVRQKKSAYLDTFEKQLHTTISNFLYILTKERNNLVDYYSNQLKSIELQSVHPKQKTNEYYAVTLYQKLLQKQLEQLISTDISIKVADTKVKFRKEARDCNQEIVANITRGTGNFESEIIRDLITPLEQVLLNCAGILNQTLKDIDFQIISYVNDSIILPKHTRLQQIRELLEHYVEKSNFKNERVDTQKYYESFIRSIKKSSPYFMNKGAHNMLFRTLSRKKLLLDTILQTFIENVIEYQKQRLIETINIGLAIEEQIKKVGYVGYEQLEELLEYYQNHPENIPKVIEGKMS